ncbi:ABC transporter ATP-binding protein [Rhodohalobacter sp.]|uniref:ABC transporter ATP-binding protein n=1 Tax=Rhodohalobacter sp. TaxID=1974210 RepID=UPI002ACD544D|nr:ABC transporter transmembrane domain-containing protein [Rhodohalobacter sp.]MDZ7756532.1 ABC transporter transmembrane domain-containing protein [Rhodohalobacter sp.]
MKIDRSSFRQYMKILAYVKPYKKKLIVALIASVLATLVWLAVPLGLRELLDAVFDDGDMALLNRVTLVLMGLFISQALLGFWGSYSLDWIGEKIVADLRKNLYEHLNRLSLKFYSNQRLGEITSRLTNDVAAIRDAVTGTLSEGLTQSINLVGSVILMVYLNWRLSLIIFITVPVITLAVRYFGQLIRKLSREVQDRLADTTAIAEETLGAIESVKSFAREPYEIGRYNSGVDTLFDTSRKKVLFSNLFWSSVGVVFMSTMIVIFWYGGTEVLAGRLSAGDLVAFIFFAFNIGRSMGGMSRVYTVFSSAVGASERIFGLLEEKPGVEDHPDAVEMDEVDGAVSFENVSFHYEDNQPVLRDISFSCEPGDIVALVGPSGAGKTTLLKLIPRFYDVQEGTIRFDGTDISTVTQQSLRNQIAVVPQDIQLFGSTIRENIRYGRLDATDREVEEAGRFAQAHDFIMEHPDGYDALVGERGIKLSGGQRQRVAIARAILKEPNILLLDEATSSLDSESEAAVQVALNHLMKSCTTFVIAHRLSTIQNATTILVMENGRILEKGTHQELLDQNGLYRRLYDIQFHKEIFSVDETANP